MRTHGHREGSTTHWGLLQGTGEGQWGVGSWGGITWGEMPGIGNRGMEAANHLALYVPMQQSCMIYKYTPEPKVQFKKKEENKLLNINVFLVS